MKEMYPNGIFGGLNIRKGIAAQALFGATLFAVVTNVIVPETVSVEAVEDCRRKLEPDWVIVTDGREDRYQPCFDIGIVPIIAEVGPEQTGLGYSVLASWLPSQDKLEDTIPGKISGQSLAHDNRTLVGAGSGAIFGALMGVISGLIAAGRRDVRTPAKLVIHRSRP